MLVYADTTPESYKFVRTSGFPLWVFLMMLTTAVMAVFIPELLKLLKELKVYLVKNRLEILMLCIIMGALFMAQFLPQAPGCISALAFHTLKMRVLLGLGLMVSLLAMVGIWLVNAALRSEFQELQKDYKLVGRFLRLRKLLQQFLTMLGILISLVVLANGALRSALITGGVCRQEEFPMTPVLLTGAFFTVLVAFAYLPTYLLLVDIGEKICDTFFPLCLVVSETWDEWRKGRKSLEEVLNVQAGVQQNLQSGIAILAPLLTSITSILLGTK